MLTSILGVERPCRIDCKQHKEREIVPLQLVGLPKGWVLCVKFRAAGLTSYGVDVLFLVFVWDLLKRKTVFDPQRSLRSERGMLSDGFNTSDLGVHKKP